MARNITIRPVLNGFVVHVGCQHVVCLTAAELGARVTEYYTSPEKIEQDYIKNAVNKMDAVLDPPRPYVGDIQCGAAQEREAGVRGIL